MSTPGQTESSTGFLPGTILQVCIEKRPGMVSVPGSFLIPFSPSVDLLRPSHFGSTGLPQRFIVSETTCLPNGKPMSNRHNRLKRRLEGLSTPSLPPRQEKPVPADSEVEGITGDQESAQVAAENPEELPAVEARPKPWWKFGR